MLDANTEQEKITEFWKTKYETETQKNWDLFYKRNTVNFYKDRHYLDKEFQEIKYVPKDSKERKVFLEIGCGVGNALFPLLETNPNLYFYGIDFSHKQYDEAHVKTLQCDIVECKEMPVQKIDFAMMLFVLSSIHPTHYVNVLAKILKAMNDNSYLFIRDYGRYDMAQLRFNADSKLSDHFYVRNDGTRAYYFTIEEMKSFIDNSVQCINDEISKQSSSPKSSFVKIEFVENYYCKKIVQNRKTQVQMHRIWVQTKIKKTLVDQNPNNISQDS
ncbi:hypothetical protein RFI_10597 [Reticulomyxa filosa]|uniref:tRNA N(3)-methylcytidine methyltransferase n=1 Tax=Reticulomyxa filosa TaxID=46433 RepID=X6NLF1_RETFI|nr:hypothetical protein RFI_10597 [Reticulomyxa filosa]|eukprot:ETO26539.1 hypothetical protein RFI_10597 [Reticulomyxa filosa]